jgi:short-subunit dehydrogenase
MPTPLEYFKRVSVIVITGGSSGIGCSVIKAIIILNPEVKICNLSRSKPEIFLGEQSIHLSVDLSQPDDLAHAAELLSTELTSAPEGECILFNNSGFGAYGLFPDLDRNKQLSMVDLNVRALVDLTARLMPILLERGGAIVNIASIAGYQPTPFLATYGATKAFVLNWSLALSEDLAATKVRVLAVCPGPTRSNFFKAAGFETPPMREGGPGLDMTSDEVADLALVALAKGKRVVVTGFKNRLISSAGRFFPLTWVTRIGGAILRKMRLEQHTKNGGSK